MNRATGNGCRIFGRGRKRSVIGAYRENGIRERRLRRRNERIQGLRTGYTKAEIFSELPGTAKAFR